MKREETIPLLGERVKYHPQDRRNFVSGIGVGKGAPGVNLFKACAKAGLDSIGAVPQVEAKK